MNNSPENIAKAIATGIVGSIGQFIDSGEEAAEFAFLSKGIAAVLLYGLIGYFVAVIVVRKERQKGYPHKRSVGSQAWNIALILSTLYTTYQIIQRII